MSKAIGNLKQYRETLQSRRFARAERFEVSFLSVPPEIDTGAIAMGDVELFCEEVQIPGMILSNKEFNIGAWTFFRNTKLGFLGNEINFSFVTTDDWMLRDVFEGWIAKCVNANNQEVAYMEKITCQVRIKALDLQDNVTHTWVLHEAMPKVLNLVPLSSGTVSAVRNTLIMSSAYWESFSAKQGPIVKSIYSSN